MKYLYLDNFRGFQHANIPIRDVNFLVGENSTGKTSLLSVLKMFSSAHFIMGDINNDDEPLFGHFEEMVSAHSDDKSYFRLGISCEIIDEKNGKRKGQCWLLTYKKVDGLAQICRLTCERAGKQIDILIEGSDFFCKIKDAPKLNNNAELSQCLLDWADQHKSDRNNGWRKVRAPRHAPIFFLLALAVSESEKVDLKYNFEIPMSEVAPPLVWIAPIRSKPRRTYDEPQTSYSSEGSHTPYVIKRMLGSENEAKKFKDFMEQVGSASGLFQKIEVKKFGDSDVSPFEVDAYLDDEALAITLMGYGVSQSLPIFVELLDRRKGSWFAIQQPEVHLHPRAQASLGDVFFEMAFRENKRFIVETHSDFTIDRFRMNYRRTKDKKKDRSKFPDSQILFFERCDKHNTVTPLLIGPHGDLPIDQPESYRSFFIREQMQMLGMK